MRHNQFVMLMSIVATLTINLAFATTVRLQVVDEENRPMPDVRIGYGWRVSSFANPKTEFQNTDTNGCCVIAHGGECILGYGVTKDGYYGSSGRIHLNGLKCSDSGIKGIDVARTIILKKIGQNAGRLTAFPKELREGKKIPVFDKWLGFDLEIGDWVQPYGGGKESDMLVRHRSVVTKKWNVYHQELDVSFTNAPYAGAYVMECDKWSWLGSVHVADSKAEFKKKFHFVRTSTQEKNQQEVLGDNQYLVFRTRTKIDEKGNLVSAHYGMINGRWRFHDGKMSIPDGCFNPTPNDTNIEDGRGLRDYLR